MGNQWVALERAREPGSGAEKGRRFVPFALLRLTGAAHPNLSYVLRMRTMTKAVRSHNLASGKGSIDIGGRSAILVALIRGSAMGNLALSLWGHGGGVLQDARSG